MVTKSKCPACASIGRDKHSDNLITYPDGGSHCFSCGYHRNGRESFQSRLKPPTANDQPLGDTYPLPADSIAQIPEKALSWLKSFNITAKELIENRICWSESRQLLLFPYDNCWQGRYFGDSTSFPRWYSKGPLDSILWGKGLETCSSSGIILCEDIISVIAVGRHFPTLCLFGSNPSRAKLGRIINHLSDNIVWWLDYDKRHEANRNVLYLQQIGFSSQAIITEKDPKCYTNQEIIQILLDNNVVL